MMRASLKLQRIVLSGLSLAAASCSPTTVLVTVSRPEASVISSLTLEVAVAGRGVKTIALAPDGGAFPSTGSVILELPDTSQDVAVTARSIDGACRVFTAQGSTHVAAHTQASLELVLGGRRAWTTSTLFAGSPGGVGAVDGTVAAARFYRPTAVVFDGANVYVADTNNNVVRRINLDAGVVSTLAGTFGVWGASDGQGAAAAFAGPSGLVLDGEGGLLVSDYGNNSIRRIDLQTAAVTTVAGGQPGARDGLAMQAQFFGPAALALDGMGNLYVADQGNSTVRLVPLDGGITSVVAGVPGNRGGTDGVDGGLLDAPAGLALDQMGSLFVTDSNGHTVRQIVLATGQVKTIAGKYGSSGNDDDTIGTIAGGSSRLNSPVGVAYDGTGSLLVADVGNNSFRLISLATETVQTLPLYDPAGIDPLPAFADGIASDGFGLFFVADTGNNAIRSFRVDGALTTLAGLVASSPAMPVMSGPADSLYAPAALAPDGSGHLFVAEPTGQVQELDDAGTVLMTPWPWRALTSPIGLAVDCAGNPVVTSWEGLPAIGRIDVVTGNIDGLGWAPADAGWKAPTGVAVDALERIYVADWSAHWIQRVDPDGGITAVAGQYGVAGADDTDAGVAALFNGPHGLALDGTGNLYVADSFNHTIRRVDLATGSVSTLAGVAGQRGFSDGAGTAARFNSPRGLYADGAGLLWVADTENSAVRQIDLTTGAVTTLVGTPNRQVFATGALPASSLFRPAAITLMPWGDMIIADDASNSLLLLQ
jgi:sugar lactone lactonase YvrE